MTLISVFLARDGKVKINPNCTSGKYMIKSVQYIWICLLHRCQLVPWANFLTFLDRRGYICGWKPTCIYQACFIIKWTNKHFQILYCIGSGWCPFATPHTLLENIILIAKGKLFHSISKCLHWGNKATESVAVVYLFWIIYQYCFDLCAQSILLIVS